MVYVIAVAAAAHVFYSRLSEHDLSGFLTFIVSFFILYMDQLYLVCLGI
nr:hypothetical protein [uncultured Psychrobacter sp.]